MRLIKNKSFRKFLYVILFVIGIFNFPSIGLLLFTILVIAFMFDSGIQNSNIKEMISVIDEFTFSILDSYFSCDTENAYKRIKPFAESLKAD